MSKYITLLFSIFSLNLQAAQEPRCYQFILTPIAAEEHAPPSIENWCYEWQPDPMGALYIYNADSPQVRPELSMLVSKEGIITHFSRSQDQLSIHRVDAKVFNPFSIPLTEPQGLSIQALGPSHQQQVSASKNLAALLSDLSPPHGMLIEEGVFRADAARIPWRGYWWPQRNGTLYNGSNSPLAKYDRFVKSQTGTSPGAVAWERSRHAWGGVSWEGHCNGWAASSILRAEPRIPRRDPNSDIVFSVSDQKGLLAEEDYCSNNAVFGRRYYGLFSSDLRDIYPPLFHKTLVYYIGNLQKLVATDYRRDEVNDNHVISGYTMDIRRTGTYTYQVTAKISIHGYDNKKIEVPGPAPEYNRTYRYNLVVDRNGNITGGKWKSTNPDYLWVPLSPKKCLPSNPRVDDSWIQKIFSLPPI